MKYMMNKAPMGWNSYDYYDTTVNEEQIKQNARYMYEKLKQYGWEYVVADIQWYASDAGTMRDIHQYIPFGNQVMDEYGRLIPDPTRFPSSIDGAGFGPLAEYVHSLGLKFGIHIMRGIPREAAHKHLSIVDSKFKANEVADWGSICPWNPDMYGVYNNEGGQDYYDSIICMYADWGIDLIKCDDICDSRLYPGEHFSGWHEIEMIAKAIEKSGRDIVLSLSPGPAHIDKAWLYEKNANMWRITDDFWDQWKPLYNMFERAELWQNHVSSGSYPDCDMLPIGKVGKGFDQERTTNFTNEEQITMMNLWCMFGSPLMIGAELTKLDEWTLSLLTNKDLLKLLSNDYVSRQVCRNRDYAIWSSVNSSKNEGSLGLFNISEKTQSISCKFSDVEQFIGSNIANMENVEVHDIWSGKKIDTTNGEVKVTLKPHESIVIDMHI